MKNDVFRFKQFEIKHDRCAQKVGTDGVLLGAWTHLHNDGRVLDIGSGSGLISLMLAQRYSNVLVDAVELDPLAAQQGRENYLKSPWSSRITQYCDDVISFAHTTQNQYGAIVSNPPFFDISLKNPEKLRAQARHTESLSFQDLFFCVNKLLLSDGSFSLILPTNLYECIVSIAKHNSLYLSVLTHVYPTISSQSKRILCEFRKTEVPLPQYSNLTIEIDRHHYSIDYIELTKEFYLKM